MYAGCDSATLGCGHQFDAPAGGIWASHDEMQIWIAVSDRGKCVNKQIAALFPIDTPEKEEKSTALHFGTEAKERGHRDIRLMQWWFCSERNDHRLPLRGPEGVAREVAFGCRGD